MEKLKVGESINLLDMKSLSFVDLDKLFEDIKFSKIHRNLEFNLKRILSEKTLPHQKRCFSMNFKNNNGITSLPLSMDEESMMNLTINSRDLEVTPVIRKHVADGMQKIREHFDHVIDATVFFMFDNAIEKALRHTAELTIHLKGRELFAEAQNDDLYHVIDAVVSELER
jgi:putative sigma-54 modulation protein